MSRSEVDLIILNFSRSGNNKASSDVSSRKADGGLPFSGNQFSISSLYSFSAEMDTYTIQPRNYQVSKRVVHEIKFRDITVIQIEKICGIVTGIIILIGSLRCLKEAKTMGHDTGFKRKFKFSFLIFSNICCWYTLELPLIEVIPMFTYSICLSKK